MLCVFEWYNEGLSCARRMSVLVFMVGELRWGEKGVPNLKRCENATIREKVWEKKEVSEVSKNITSPKVNFLGKPRNTSVNVLAIGRLYIYEYIFYILFFIADCSIQVHILKSQRYRRYIFTYLHYIFNCFFFVFFYDFFSFLFFGRHVLSVW